MSFGFIFLSILVKSEKNKVNEKSCKLECSFLALYKIKLILIYIVHGVLKHSFLYKNTQAFIIIYSKIQIITFMFT